MATKSIVEETEELDQPAAAANGAAGERILGREEILAAADRVTAVVPVPEWGGSVIVQSLTGRERDRYEMGLITGRGSKRDLNLRAARVKLVVLSVVDRDGRRLFSEADVEALLEKNAAPLNRIFDRASELSGLSESAIEELTAELGNDPSDASGSG